MTQQEKTMKKYMNAIERRLNLPRALKARVMSDFMSSIAARREAGQTDEQIYTELGTPKKVADELNEQMAEFAYRKSPWRFACLALAIVSGAALVWKAFMMLLVWIYLRSSEAASVGIIGGADGPTAIFVTTRLGGFPTELVVILALLVVGVVGFLRLRRCKKS